ncbi:ESPR-type extended signal peptide-containing protein [uncultured Dialister sp.]|uniref:ESPR-type extended signal peptide-containing protein n=1 Tax=uncultured Dialister sp. TaxID=278064 RepID=UPI0026DCE97D|nr:ESPR-type extended signal peptide-containing protein [uncultured Dialister sp.]
MNHIYKVVWSRARNCYMAVSEIAKGHQKGSGRTKVALKMAVLGALTAVMLTTGGVAGTVWAADPDTLTIPENNTVTSTDKSNTTAKDLNANIKGKDNKVTNSKDVEIVGDKNTVTDVYYNDDGKTVNGKVPSNNVRVVGSNNSISGSRNQHVIGDNNTIIGRDDGTVTDYSHPEGRESYASDLTIGRDNFIHGDDTYRNEWDSLTVIGNHNRADYSTESAGGPAAGIVIGDNQNIDRIKESIVIGSLSPAEREETFVNNQGDTIEKYQVGEESIIVGYHASSPAGVSVVVGSHSQANSFFQTVVGHRSVVEGVNEPGNYNGSFASSYGSLNKIGNTAKSLFDYTDANTAKVDGFGNNISGNLNTTSNATGTMVIGQGNSVSNSQNNLVVSMDGDKVPLGLKWVMNVEQAAAGYSGKGYITFPASTYYDMAQSGMRDYMTNSSGAVSVLGNGNAADYAIRSQILGTGNSLTGTEENISAYNTVSGFANSGTNVKRTAIVGTGNTLNSGEDNVVIGDYHQLEGGKHNVILGSMATEEKEVTKKAKYSADEYSDDNPDASLEYTVKEQVPVKKNTSNIENAVMLGYNTDVSESGGVALGSGSVASIGAGVSGWDPTTKKVSTKDSNVWKSSWAAVSVGDAANKFTRQITNAAAGYNDTDAVNVAQLKAAMNNAGSKISLVAGDGIKIEGKDGTYTISANITGGTTNTDTTEVDGKTGTSGDSGSTDKGNTDTSGNGKQLVVTTDTNPTKFAADEGTAAEVKPSETLTINGDKTNITTKVDGKAISVKLKDDISVKTVNATSVTATDSIGIKDGPSMTTNGIDAAGRKITHVAAGTETTDAVNYGQLKGVESKVDNNTQAITNINGRVGELGSRINKVGAGAAALAALHPLDFDPSDKWDFAAGVGNYRNETAAAVGLFYRPNARSMFNIGWTMGDNRNMVNGGFSIKLGRGSAYNDMSKAQMAETISGQATKIDRLESTVDQQDKKIAKLEEMLKKQGEMIEKLAEKK